MSNEECDPCLVCGEAVPAGEGIREGYEGHRCCFCSREHQAQFEAAPEDYLELTQCLMQPPGYW